MRFDLIDQVLERDEDRIVAVKNVTLAEEYLADHFPGFAVFPGVMMLETLVQAGRRLLAERGESGPWVLAEVRNVRYGNMVRPGEALKVTVELRGRCDDGFEMDGAGVVSDQDQVAVQARIRLVPLPSESASGS